ncbi:glycosyl hydrolase [Plectosphaerella plurivora]|uniref:Glycosyl hydrolase n=1 Tax=Plectosphaerella plurivora TaxID=936078 RepID=A0A9P9AFU3_9PEZI|nr:glycosyl hydrolase [Plectosphaerella plurivora]
MRSRDLLWLVAGVVSADTPDLTQFVKTDTGTIAGGNAFPGVSRPYGMAKLGPDLENGHDAYSGYLPDGEFIGFSMLHEHGTGGAPKYGVVNQMPIVGTIDNPMIKNTDTRQSPDETEVGYYKSTLGSGVVVELAAADRAGLYKYTFPSGGSGANVIVDVSHVLKSYRGQGLGQSYLGGSISVDDKRNGDIKYTGHGTYNMGWNRAGPWTVYFCGYFDKAAKFKTFIGKDLTSQDLSDYDEDTSRESKNARVGAVFSFSDAEVTSRVGVSFISTEQACGNVDREIPAGTTLTALRDETRTVWNEQILSKVQTTDTDDRKRTQLYTALYFMNLLPQNKTGENPGWKSDEPYYDDIFTFWDTFRCTTSLMHIVHPTAYEEFIRSLIDTWRHEGYVSDARSSFWNGAVQAGSNSDNVLADAYVKGVRGKVDWDDGFAAMVKNAEVTPENNDDNRDPRGSTKEGRGALPDWLEYGYITSKFTRSITRAVEYSVNDFALYQVARGLKKQEDAEKYLNRSHNWRNQWNPDLKALGFSGFLGPREHDGFKDHDPLSCGGCYWGDLLYQGLSWEYSFNAHHDMGHLINLTGGPETFTKRLEKTFEQGAYNGNGAFGNTIFNPGNEPSFGTPYLYNFVNRQSLSVERSRYIAREYYKPSPDGLPGNSDAGAMESWLLWSMIGMYPLTGQTTFLIVSPWFKDLRIALAGGKELHITATGIDEDYHSWHVQSLKVNGKSWDRNWLTWSDVFAEGGTMEFELGREPKEWDTGAPPPSPGTDVAEWDGSSGGSGDGVSSPGGGGDRTEEGGAHTSPAPGGSSGLSTGATVGIVVGAVGATALLAGLLVKYFLGKRREAATEDHSGTSTPNLEARPSAWERMFQRRPLLEEQSHDDLELDDRRMGTTTTAYTDREP